jgi:hypothetical protein
VIKSPQHLRVLVFGTRITQFLQRIAASKSRMVSFIDLKVVARPDHSSKWDVFSHDQIHLNIQGSLFMTKRLAQFLQRNAASKPRMASLIDLKLIAGPDHIKWDVSSM